MDKRDETPVTAELDRQRMYRANDDDREAIVVNPGRVTIPAWVAEAWGLTPTKPVSTGNLKGKVGKDAWSVTPR